MSEVKAGGRTAVRAQNAQFVPEVLAELRRGNYAPAAWARFLGRSFRRSIDDAQREPALLRSALRQSGLLAGITLAALLWHGRRFPAPDQFRKARHVGLALLIQQSFVVSHLGMAQATAMAPRFKVLGSATFLTLLRGVCAMLLRTTDTADLPLLALFCATGSATDALDGAVARRCGEQSRLGAMLDPAMDVAFYRAMVNAAIARGALPRWFGWVVVARFLVPIGAGLYRYFGTTQTLEAAHTVWGKGAGVLLTALVALGTVRPRTARRLCLPAAALVTVTGALQCRRALRPGR
jgi:phosphatidylglycerophosphate synthase